MEAHTLRQRFLTFFQQHEHAVIRAAPLIPENDPSVLFTTAGMHPLVPFLLGEPHPAGTRLANYQVCLRTNDILEVGDATHLTLFEMLGSWSLGAYWKEQAIRLNYRLLTEVFGHDPERLFVTCFAGDADAPRDEEAASIWQAIGIPKSRIAFLSKEDNWWGPAGETGPCGPDSEVFFDTNPTGPQGETPASNPQRFWEVCNNVFMSYERRSNGTYVPLQHRNVDVGVGLERNLMVLQGAASVFDTDLFQPIMDAIQSMAQKQQPYAIRIIADHLRAAMFLLAEGIRPGNTDQPYVARRLIRRMIRYGRELQIGEVFLGRLAETVIPSLNALYPELTQQRDSICGLLDEEEHRFQQTLARGEREFKRAAAACEQQGTRSLPGHVAFRLYDTFGFPLELTEELARERDLEVDSKGFYEASAAHQKQSRQGASVRFKGGLAEQNPATTQLHTATHLLQAALRHVLGPHVAQRGSNITPERLRFDFSHGERMQPAQLAAVEALVNEQIERDILVSSVEMSLVEAREHGALGVFEERYGERVNVYQVGDFSCEICGGPHVQRTSELGRFRIVKEEAVAAGVRRIRAVLE
jgi:alanyl-tRNA synthetase